MYDQNERTYASYLWMNGMRGVGPASANERIEHYQNSPIVHPVGHMVATCATAENARDTRCTQMFMTAFHSSTRTQHSDRRWLADEKNRRVLHAWTVSLLLYCSPQPPPPRYPFNRFTLFII